MHKRTLTKFLTFAVAGSVLAKIPRVAFAQQDPLLVRIRQIEQNLGARLGVAISDSTNEIKWDYRSDERFALCSTFKVIAVAALLLRVDRGLDSLSRRVSIHKDDLVSYSPETELHVGEGAMSLSQICEAALTLSDNTAGNKILESIGGPSGVTDFARSLGDTVTRLDRWETELNEAAIGDERDTSTPRAMVNILSKLLQGNILSEQSRTILRDWMIANKTGDAKLRAGVPVNWVVGDKTGGGNNGSMADVALLERPKAGPMYIAVYMTETNATFDARNEAIADIARAFVKSLSARA